MNINKIRVLYKSVLNNSCEIVFKKGKAINENTAMRAIFKVKIVNTIDFSFLKSFSSESHLIKAAYKLNDNIVVSKREVVSTIPIIPNSLILNTEVYRGSSSKPTILSRIFPMLYKAMWYDVFFRDMDK